MWCSIYAQFYFFFSGGGEFSFKICQNNDCCDTGELDTQDDNWEVGEANFFVGRTLGTDCKNFRIDGANPLTLKVQHSGNDGGKIENITLTGSKNMLHMYHTCTIGVKLDNDEFHEVECTKNPAKYGYSEACNGHPEFCSKRFNKGFGQVKSFWFLIWRCADL